MVGVYKITSPVNKVYIGQSWDIEKRFKKDYKNANLCKNQPKLSSSFVEFGVENHSFEVLTYIRGEITQDYLNWTEQLWMNIYKERGFELLNLRKAGNRGKHSHETILKMKGLSTKWLTGRKHSEETKFKMSISHKGIPKPPRSEEHKRKLSESHKGHSWSIKQRKAIDQLTLDGVFIKKWESTNAVKAFLGTKNCNFLFVCQGKRKQCRGFKWRYSI